jgi:ubiquinone/menaquinone biosynthesis C-methylase UbiE
MRDYAAIYRSSADQYDRMVTAEDTDRAVISSLASLLDLSGARVVEVGVGTGRITRQLVAARAKVVGVEPVAAMLAIARRHVAELGADASGLVEGSLASLPFASAGADLAVAGWVFGHQRSFEPDRWRDTVAAGVAEMLRVVRPGAPVVLFETLGTAVEAPTVRPELAELQAHLEQPLGFTRRVVRTDYAFATADEAADTLAFFFGDAVASEIRRRDWARVPEWTGVWTRVRP